MYRNLLVPIDGGELSDRAMLGSIDLARQLGATITHRALARLFAERGVRIVGVSDVSGGLHAPPRPARVRGAPSRGVRPTLALRPTSNGWPAT